MGSYGNGYNAIPGSYNPGYDVGVDPYGSLYGGQSSAMPGTYPGSMGGLGGYNATGGGLAYPMNMGSYNPQGRMQGYNQFPAMQPMGVSPMQTQDWLPVQSFPSLHCSNIQSSRLPRPPLPLHTDLPRLRDPLANGRSCPWNLRHLIWHTQFVPYVPPVRIRATQQCGANADAVFARGARVPGRELEVSRCDDGHAE
jgi:hypothetical protein